MYEFVSIGAGCGPGAGGEDVFLCQGVQHLSVLKQHSDAACFSILSCTDCVESTAHYARWSNGLGSLQLVRTRSILGAVPFARDADGLTTLRGGRVRVG